MLNGSFQWLPLCLNLEQPCSFEILFGRNSCDGSEIRKSLHIDIERLRKFICTYAHTHTQFTALITGQCSLQVVLRLHLSKLLFLERAVNLVTRVAF